MNIKISQDSERHPSRKNYWKWSVWIEGPDAELDQIREVPLGVS